MSALPAMHRPMDSCSICLERPGRCTCPKMEDALEESPLPEMSPTPPDEQLRVEWPERTDIA